MDIIKDYWAVIVILAGIFGIEFTKPFKIEPIKWCFKPIRYVLGIEVLSKRVDELYKTNDFNHSIEVKSKMVALKKLQQSGRYLDEDQWQRYYEQEKRYKFLFNKYPNEMNGHMERLMNYMNEEYKKGNVCIGNCKGCLANCDKKE